MFEKRVVKENEKNGFDSGSIRANAGRNSETRNANKVKKSTKGSNSLVSISAIVIPLVLAVIVTGLIFVIVKKQNTSKIITKDVVVAVKAIPVNTFIEKDDIAEYFDTVSVDALMVSDNSIDGIKSLPENGFYIKEPISEKQVIYEEDILKSDTILDKYKEGYQTTSVAVDSFDNSVAGTIRKGNIVDIYAIDPAENMLKLMASDVYVLAAYDSSGTEIVGEGVATAFTIMVAEEEKEAVNMAITYGGIQLYLSEE